MTNFTVLLAGDITPTARLAAQIAGTRIIAADSGMRHAAVLGVVPELWLGDFDSASDPLLADYGEVPRLVFPAAKSMTDGELAVEEALQRGATGLVLVGQDHDLSPRQRDPVGLRGTLAPVRGSGSYKAHGSRRIGGFLTLTDVDTRGGIRGLPCRWQRPLSLGIGPAQRGRCGDGWRDQHGARASK